MDNHALRDQDLALPNIYYTTTFYQGQAFTTYVAADFSGAAIRKVQRWCEETHGFKPVRANSDTKMRRMKLGDYMECPEAVSVAIRNAADLGERGTVKALERRHDEVQTLLSGLHGSGHGVDFNDVADQLAAALREIA